MPPIRRPESRTRIGTGPGSVTSRAMRVVRSRLSQCIGVHAAGLSGRRRSVEYRLSHPSGSRRWLLDRELLPGPWRLAAPQKVLGLDRPCPRDWEGTVFGLSLRAPSRCGSLSVPGQTIPTILRKPSESSDLGSYIGKDEHGYGSRCQPWWLCLDRRPCSLAIRAV